MKHLLVSLVLTLIFSANITAASEIKIAAIDWCPYICDVKSDSPGILVEYVQLAYQDTHIDLTFTLYPWSRAIKEVESGIQTALLAPAKSEAPQLVYPQFPIGQQQFCFFTRQSDRWQYQKPQDLFERVTIYPTNALPEELLVMVDHTDILKSESYNDDFLANSSKLLKQEYIDGLLITDYSMRYFLMQSQQEKDIKNAGCVQATDLFLAFTPKKIQQESVRTFIHLLDRALQTPDTRKKMAGLAAKYGI